MCAGTPSAAARYSRLGSHWVGPTQAREQRFDAVVTPTAHLQRWWQTESAKRHISTPVLRAPLHHSRGSAWREQPFPLRASLNTICYCGSSPEPEMYEAVQQWADAHNATFEVRTVRRGIDDPHRCVNHRACTLRFGYWFGSAGRASALLDVPTCGPAVHWDTISTRSLTRGLFRLAYSHEVCPSR